MRTNDAEMFLSRRDSRCCDGERGRLSAGTSIRGKQGFIFDGRVVTPWPSRVVLCFTPSPLSSRTRLHENVASASAVSTRQRKPRRPSTGVAPAVNVTRHPWLRLLTPRYSHFRGRRPEPAHFRHRSRSRFLGKFHVDRFPPRMLL